MEREPGTSRLRTTLDDLKRKLQQEREAAETLTHHLTAQRDQNRAAEESRVKKLELELAAAHKQLAEQKEASERLMQQLAATGSEAQSRIRKLEEELAAAQSRMRDERGAAEELVQRLAAERDEARAQLSEVESRTRAIEEEFTAGQEQFREQREAAIHLIQQLEGERDESRVRLSELEARAQWLEEELATAREKLQEEMKKATVAEAAPVDRAVSLPADTGSARQDLYWRMAVPLTLVLVSTDLLASSLQSNPAMLEAVRDIQLQSQKLLEGIRGHERKASSEGSSAETPSPSNPAE